MNAQALLRVIDQISYWSGKAFAWLIVALTFVVSIEVFKRYILNAPTAWIFDLNNMLYGTLFMMCGAYTLRSAGHVRADFVYIYLQPRAQAGARSRACIFCSSSPASSGSSMRATATPPIPGASREHSNVTAEGPPIYHFKTVIPIAGALVMLQGLAEIVRCIVCIRTGAWPARLDDVEEIDVIETQLSHSEYVDEESRLRRDGDGARDRRRRAPPQRHGRGRGARESDQRRRAEQAMSDPVLGLTMLGLIVVAIMMGFPTAFTLMGLGMIFGYIAFWDPAQHWWQNRIFDLMVQRTYGVMTNDTLLSVPLFVFMGYIMERAALVDRMFHSVQLAFRRVPASLAVTTLLVCAFWGIASGIVGAVVVLMGVIALRPMLNAGYDVRLASGAITAGGTLGILIPPSVMLIVYAAVAGQSIVKLYAAAMLPGFFLTFLYLVYILGWAIINPKIAPKLPPDQYRVAVPDWLKRLESGRSRQRRPRAHRRRVSTGLAAWRDDAGRPTARLRLDRQQRARADGAGGADGRHVRRDLVVRGRLQCARRRKPRPALAPPAVARRADSAPLRRPPVSRSTGARRGTSRRNSERRKPRCEDRGSARRPTRRPRR